MDSENRKFTLLSFLAFSALCAYIFYLIATQVADWMKWGGSNVLFGQPWVVVGGSIAALFGVILLIALSTSKKSTAFIDEVFSEIQKTTWPNGRDTTISTVVVSILIGIAALVLFVVDYFWGVFFRAVL
mgnify:CR=1 FL=1